MAAWTDGLRRLVGLPAEEKKSYQIVPGDASWLDRLISYNFGSKAGQSVTWQTALQVSAVLACVRVIAEGLAQPPMKLIRRTGADGREEARDHPLWNVLYRRPNQFQTSFELREMLGFHVVLTGNAFALKVRNRLGQVVELLPFEPGNVTVQRDGAWNLRYRLRTRDGKEFNLSAADVWHLKGPSWTGWLGMDAVHIARNSIGLAQAAEEFGSDLFANGARPSGVLSTDSTLGDETLKQIKEAWQAAHATSGQRMGTAILQGGLKWQQLSVNANEAQFIETRRFMVEEICRVFRVNPVKVMSQMNNMAYASVEQLNIAHVNDTLGPWHERIEQSAEVALLSEAELKDGYEIEIVDHVLTRGTRKERADTLAVLRQNGVITGNEFREQMDFPRDPDPVLNQFTPAQSLFGRPAGTLPGPASENRDG